MKAYMDIKITL